MKIPRFLLFLLLLPFTLFLDFLLYGMFKSCPACGSFTEWIKTEGAVSFPIVVELVEYANLIGTGLKNKLT